jgi:Double zinc ribbon
VRRVSHALLTCAVSAFVAQDIAWRQIADQLALFAHMLLIIAVSALLGALALSMLPHAVQAATRLQVLRSKRRSRSRWASAQHTAELEAASGHSMMWEGTCPSCTASLVMNAEYCSVCGKKVRGDPLVQVIVCPACSVTNPASGRFCAGCGAPLPKTSH